MTIDDKTKNQITECINLLKQILNEDLLGVYLYGSAIVGGLQKYSDLDLFVVSARALTADEKTVLVENLLTISGIYMKGEKYPLELTIVVKSLINPWRYPPTFDFQYGEWLRTEFERGNIEPWATKVMPDLALLITQVLLANRTIFGMPPNQLLCTVPYRDFLLATIDSLKGLMTELHGDTRNVLLTYARIWNTLETDTINSKPVVACWARDRLPQQYKPVLERARSICVGETDEDWNDIQNLIKPCADFMLEQINVQIKLIENAGYANKSIRLS